MNIAQSRILIPKNKPDTLKRIRLLDLLHENVHRKLTFISAPAGFGKTTLLVDFARDIDAEIFWYQIGSTDLSLNIFLKYLIHSFQKSIPEFGKNLLDLIDLENSPNAQTLAIEFSNEVISHVHDFSLMVLDDYHLVSHVADIVNFLEKLLEILPEQLRILVGSRNVYGIPSAELYIQDELATFSKNELAFITSELLDFSNNYFQVQLTEAQAEKIIEHTEGWIIAIFLALRNQNLEQSLHKLSGNQENIFEFFDQEIFNLLDQRVRTFLLISSLFEEFTIDLCKELLPDSPVNDYIQLVINQNLFISLKTLENKTEVYQYHQLFHAYLNEKREQIFSPDQIRASKRAAAKYFFNISSADIAIEFYIDANEWAEACSLADQYALKFYVSGQNDFLQSIYERLDQELDLVTSAPHLMLHTAKVYVNRENYQKGLSIYDRVEPELRRIEDWESLVNLLVSKGIPLAFSGNHQQALEIGLEALEIVQDKDLDRYFIHQAERLIGRSEYYLGHFNEAIKWLKKSADGIRELLNNNFQDRLAHELVMILSDMGYFTLVNGDLFQAQKSYHEALKTSKLIRGHLGDLAISANNYGYILHLNGNFQASWKQYETALQAAKSAGWQRLSVNIQNGRGELLADLGLLDEARKEYLTALDYKDDQNPEYGIDTAYLGLANIALQQGDFNQSFTCLRQAAEWAQQELDTPKITFYHAAIYHAMGQMELSKKHLETILKKIEDTTPSELHAKCIFLLARVYFELGQKELSKEQLDACLLETAQLGYDQFLFEQARNASDFIKNALKNRKLPQLADLQKRINNNQLTMEALLQRPIEIDTSAAKLTIKAFGSGQVYIQKNKISDSDWRSVGARALFFYILEHAGVSKQQIALDFWPDFSPGKINSNFHATLWRVRNALGNKDIIKYENQLYSIDSESILDIDVQRFDTMYERFLEQKDDIQKVRQSGYQLLDIYQGDYLLDIDMAWADEKRMDLRQKYINVMEKLAQTETQLKHYENAKKLYSQLVRIESFNEYYHFGLISSLASLQEYSAAKRHYESYAKMLAEEMGLEPEQELKALYKKL